MSSFNILLRGYFPGLASNNHCLGWLKSFDQLGIKATVFNLRPNDEFERMPDAYKNLTIVNLWDNRCGRTKSRLLRFVMHHINVWRFTRMVKKGDVVWVYDLPEAIIRLVKRKGIHLYNEVTEHPEVGSKTFFDKKRICKQIKAIPCVDGLFVISTQLKHVYESRGVDKDKIHIINMTVDPSRFDGIKKLGGDKCIVYCGNGANTHEVAPLLKSFSLVYNKYPDFKLKIIGSSPKRGDVSGIVELVEQLNVEDAVVFTGRKSPEEVPQLLKNATILALDRPNTLQAQNGFPTKLGEYLLTGNPVCVTNVGDIPLFLEDGVSAFVAAHDDAEDFASKLIWIIEHPHEASIVGTRGREVALKYFNPMVEAKKMLKCMGLYT